MLSLEQIKTQYSLQEQQFSKALLKEYLQYQVLSIAFSSFLGEKLTFTGGTAVRIAYGSDRFSEDLDFDVPGLSENEFDRFTKYLETQLEKKGLITEHRNVHKGVYRCYLKFPHLLCDYKLSDLVTEKILIQLDLSDKVSIIQGTTFLLNKFDVFKEIRVYSPEILILKKIEALLRRKRTKGRDIYDIVYLFSQVSPEALDFGLLDEKLGIHNLADLKVALKEFIKQVNLKDLAMDVRLFLLDPQKVDRVLLFDRFVAGL